MGSLLQCVKKPSGAAAPKKAPSDEAAPAGAFRSATGQRPALSAEMSWQKSLIFD